METDDFSFLNPKIQSLYQNHRLLLLSQPLNLRRNKSPFQNKNGTKPKRGYRNKSGGGRMRAKIFGGQPQQPQPQNKLEAFIQDPDAYEQRLLDQAAQRMEHTAVISEYQAKYPEYVPYEAQIQAEMHAALQEIIQKGGRLPPFREALDLGIKRFEAGIQKLSAKFSAQPQNTRLMAMQPDVSGTTPQSQNTDLAALAKQNPDKFWDVYNAKARQSAGF